VFLLAEWKESFFIIDQHAAHEKILYERFKRSAKEIQDLLFPVSFDTSPRERDRLLKNASTLSDFGINIEQVGDRTFEIVSLSSEFLSIEEGELVGIIKNIKKTVEQLEDEILKLAACHAAVKEGDPLDSVTARELVRAAFNLENARCPHGRPIWHHLSRDDLYRLVDRM
jgi:DNA mismatch repair protein MutL